MRHSKRALTYARQGVSARKFRQLHYSAESEGRQTRNFRLEAVGMAMYRTCPLCGAHLDPGEACDCQEIKETKKEEKKDGSKSDDSN